MKEEIVAIFAQAKISSALALGVSWPDGKRRQATHIFLGAPSFFSDEKVDETTVFDLASITKPLVTTLCLHHLVCQGKLTLADTLANILSEASAADAAVRQISIGQLLSHSSGLPAHRPYYSRLVAFSRAARKEALLAMILNEKPLYAAGCEHLYSDLGFMLLGFVIERLTGESLDAYWRRTVARKIGVENDLFFPRQEKCQHVFAETGICPWSKQILTGTVHDDNCRSLGGIAGHAGLFGTLDGVMTVCDWLLALWPDTGHEAEILQKMCTPAPGASWCLGFDSPSGPDSASGRYFQAPSIGHLGFTGTSFWIDLKRRISVVLLTNRTIFSWDRAEMNRFRREIYNCVMKRFEDG